jgi:hypothetical protein
MTECRKDIRSLTTKGIVQSVQTHSKVLWMFAVGIVGLLFDRFRG